MMENIRTAANSVIVKIIFGVIILAFIFTGVGGFLGFGGNSADDERLYIAKVDGEGISRAAFEREAQLATQNVGTIAGYDDLKILVRNQLFQQIVTDNLIYKMSEKLNVGISNEQVKNKIKQQSVFFKNGQFNNQLYLELLQANGYTPEIYAETIRSDLKKRQLIASLIQTEFTLPIESEIGKLYEQKRTIYTASIPRELVEVPENLFSDDELFDYYENNKTKFDYKNELFKLKTVSVSRPLIEMKVKVSDDEVKTYYQNNKTNYVDPARYAYSVIELNNIDDADKVYSLLEKSTDFQQLIKEYSNEGRPSMSGKLGWFKEGSIPAELEKANLTKKSSFSKPILLDSGSYLIVKLEDVQPSRQIPLDIVFNQVKYDLIQTITTEKFKQEEAYLSNLVKQGLSLEKMEQKLKERLGDEISLVETSWLNKNISLMHFSEIQEAIDKFGLIDNDGEPIDTIVGPILVDEINTIYVFKLVNHRHVGQQPFEKVKDDIKNTLINRYITDTYTTFSNELVNDFNEKGVDSSKGIKFTNRQTIMHYSHNVDQAIIDTTFSLVQQPSGKSVYGLASLKDENVIVTITNVDTPESVEANISEQLLDINLNSIGYSFAQDLRSKANIEIMPDTNL